MTRTQESFVKKLEEQGFKVLINDEMAKKAIYLKVENSRVIMELLVGPKGKVYNHTIIHKGDT